MCLLRQRMVLLFTGMLVIVLLPTITAENEKDTNSECVLGDIESRLSIASEIIESAKKKLPKDLKDFCKNFVGNDCNILDRNETHMCECNETKILDCNETKILDYNETKIFDCNETKILDCNETKTFDCNVTQIFECNETNIADCKECENKTCYAKPLDCSDIYLKGEHRNGLYYVWPQSRMTTDRLQVFCDMESDGGGWTVIQRRGEYGNNKDYFYRKWDSYKTGFGDLLKEFWIGNDNMFALTSQRQYQLRVNLTAWEGEVAYATYEEFWILDENVDYTLHVKGYNGTAGDSFSYHDGQKFSTIDRKNDISPNRHCAQVYKGAWWHKDCYYSNLNGLYLRGNTSQISQGVVWWAFKGGSHSLRDSVMKIRPAAFEDMRNRMY